MIRAEDVADLREGDVVELRADHWPEGSAWRGPLYGSGGDLRVCGGLVRNEDGEPLGGEWSLTVVSRAPRPLYVNHPRTEPVQHDVVGDADDCDRRAAWISAGHTTDGDQLWVNADAEWCYRADLPARLRLLVDGTTGQAVPS